jgi:hypothetical protein
VVAVASDGQNFFVLWKDTRAPTGQGKALYGTRVGADGTPLDSESLQFTTEHVYYDPDVVFDGANFVVNWSDPPQGEGDSDALNTVRVSPAGERLDVEPLHPPLCGNVAGASDGTLTLLVGHKCGYDQNLALLLDQDGAVASELIPIPGVQEPSPVASFDGTHYLVVFSDENQTSGQLITQAGELEGQPFSVLGPSHIHVKIAGGGGNHLLVWEGPLGVEFRRVSSDGQALDAGLVALLENSGTCTHESDLSDCSEPSVAFDGENFVVAWRELSIPAHASSLDLYAAKVSPEGEVSPRFPISQEPEREGAPFVAVNGEGQVLATYNRFVPGPPYDTRRAVATLLP